MKKIFFTLLLTFAAFSANAQFHFGGQFNINFGNQHTDYSNGSAPDNKELAYIVNLRPKVYWNIGEKMQAGGRIGFAFGRMATGLVYDEKKKSGSEEAAIEVNRAVGWSVSPFFGYRVLSWKIVSVWAEANAFVGQYYNVNKPQIGSKEWGKEWGNQLEYGFQILPVVNIDLTEKLALQLHLGFISLGWYGTRADYPDRVVTTSSWDLHKGGFAGILQGLTDYGIGLVKRF